MDDPAQIPADNIKTNDNRMPSSNLRPSEPEKWESNEDQPNIKVQLSPDGVPVQLGEIDLPENENVRQYVVIVTGKNGTEETFTVSKSFCK